MKKVIGAIIAGILILFVLLMVSEYRQESRTFIGEQSFTAQINTERAKRGLDPVVDNDELIKLANYKCNDLITRNYYAHRDPDGKMIWDFAPEGFKYGENLATSYFDSTAVVQAWVASPKHLENIVDPMFTQIGHATCYDGKQFIVVEVFKS